MRDGRICGGKHSLIAGISSAFATHIYNKSRLLLPNPKPYYEGCRKKNFLQGRIIARLPAQFILPQPPSHGRCIEGNPQQKREDRAGQRGIACRQLKEQPSAQPKNETNTPDRAAAAVCPHRKSATATIRTCRGSCSFLPNA